MTSVIVQRSWLRSLILRSLFFVGAIMVAFLVLVAASALGQGAPTPDVGTLDPVAFLKLIFDAIQNKNWGAVASIVVVLFVWAVRKFDAKLPVVGPYVDRALNTKIGGWVFNFATVAAGALGTAVLAGQPITWALLGGVATVGLGSTSIWELIKDVKEWLDSRAKDKVTVPGGDAGGSVVDIAKRL